MAVTVQPWMSTKFLPSIALDDTQPSDLGLHAGLSDLTHVIVRNPPRTHLPPDSSQFCEDLETHCPENFVGVPTEGLYLTYSPSRRASPELVYSVLGFSRQKIGMPKKRPSLHSLLTPSFLSLPTSPTSSDFGTIHVTNDYIPRARSSSSVDQVLRSQHDQSPSVTSHRSSPPPAFLIDDDPFANLSPARYASYSHSMTPPRPPRPSTSSPPTSPRDTVFPTPRSPLSPSTETKSLSFARRSSSTALPSGISRTLSGRARPAYQKLAFSPRPSLPSLDTLAKLNVVLSPKVRKGRVGAKLPSEPWDNLQSVPASATSPSSSQDPAHSFLLPEPSGNPEFVSDLDSDSVDFSSDEDMDEIELMASFNYDAVLDNAHFDQSGLTYGVDTENSVSDTSPPSLSRTASSSLSPLTRSTSFTSNSSAWLSDAHRWPSLPGHSNSMSYAESDSDILSSPPEEYLSFPTSGYSSNAITDLLWSSHSRFENIDLETDQDDLQFSDVSYLHEPEVIYEPGTSADTVRPLMNLKTDPESHPGSQLRTDNDQVVDGVGWEEREGQKGDQHDFYKGQDSGGTSGNGNGGNGSGDGHSGGNGRERFGGRGDDDEDDRRNRFSAFSTPPDSELSDETEDESTDDYGEEPVTEAASRGSSDDDVPLAQRIPTALRAQRTIRRQVREERETRRKERPLRAEQGERVRSRQLTLRPAGAGDPLSQSSMSSSQEAALHASKSLRRPRTATLPSNAVRPFSPEDLARRLQTVEVAGASAARLHRSPSMSIRPRDVVSDRPGSAGRSLRDVGPVSYQTIEVPLASTTHHYLSPSMGVRPKDVMENAGRSLRDDGPVPHAACSPPEPHPESHRAVRPMRSFHRLERRKVDDHFAAHMPNMPIDAEMKLGRSLTRTVIRDASARSHSHSHSHNASPHPLPIHTTSEDKVAPRRSGDETRKVMKNNYESKSARPSLELERSRPSMQRPPVPPLPSAEVSISASVGRGSVTQQRVFIGDKQRFNIVEIGPSTNAGDVIEMVEAQGSLKGWVGSGDWMVWEIAQDFGMERPVRSFELLVDIQSSWNKDRMLNTFVIRLTPLAAPLSRSAIPSASPTYAGYVDWESKRGKWTKRWLQLREHNLYLAKRDNGRDEVLLCSLSNFDAYFITRLHKSPRPFTFAVKSTDNLSFFENKADYLHVFSCGEKEGNIWMEKILVARSYVLHQEKHILFNPKASNSNAAGGILTRAGTRKASSARPPQALIAASPPYAGPFVSLARNDVFEPGSLLHKQI